MCWQLLTPKTPDLFADYFQPHTNTLYPNVKSSELVDEVMQTFLWYQEGAYKKALSGFEKMPAEKVNDGIAFYKANTLLQLGKVEAVLAILHFMKCLNIEQGRLNSNF